MRHVTRRARIHAYLAAVEPVHRHIGQALIEVTRRDHLVACGQVEPELQRMRHAISVRHLAVQGAASGGHPLDVALRQHAMRAGVVAMFQFAAEHQRHGLEAAVRMGFEAAR
jgi:hypothetical protein